MPAYSFRNNDTGEEFDLTMKMAEREEFLNSNPHIQQIFTKFPGVVDPRVTGHQRHSDGFNDLLRNMAKHHYGNTIQYR